MPLPAEQLGSDEEFRPSPGLPPSLQSSIDTFVAQAVAALVPRMPSGAPKQADIGVSQIPKAAAGGMVWLFDPEHWTGFDADVTEDLKAFVWSLTKQASRVITDRCTRAAATPSPFSRRSPLGWLFAAIAGNQAGLGHFSLALRQHLQGRGMSHLVNQKLLRQLFWSPEAYDELWLDVLIKASAVVRSKPRACWS